ncbi:MAG: tetratricopeptide repeat protein [Desulfovibrio sp.]|nr:tetratricopeptide repeat protein [Desulfovibrio sp.]
MTTTYNIHLSSSDIFERQDSLCEALAAFLPFNGHTLYFPPVIESPDPSYIAREKKVLLPLFWGEKSLGMLILHKVKARHIKPFMPFLPSVARLILEKIALGKAVSLDQETGLCREQAFYDYLEEESTALQAQDVAATELPIISAYRLCVGIVMVRLSNGEELGFRCGHVFVRDLLRRFASVLVSHTPADGTAIRFGRYEAGILFHANGREKCRTLASELLTELLAVKAENPFTNNPVYPVLAVSYVYYPHDMRPREQHLSVEEQCFMLRQRLSLALDCAAPGTCLGVKDMLTMGGRVVELLPLGRYKISLGRMMGAYIGQRFSLFGVGESNRYKGEITILQTAKKSALACMSYQETPGVLPEPGDRLKLLTLEDEVEKGEIDGVLSARRFYGTVQEETRSQASFSLVMLHIDQGEAPRETPSEPGRIKKGMEILRERIRMHFGDSKRLIFGLQGENILLVFHPDEKPESLLAHYVSLAEGETRFSLSAGIAGYPCLSFRKTDIGDLSAKALEYARLLPEPRVGLCNSLAFNISADKLYSMGDLFGALEDYKRALLLDKENDLAWNSMGVCMAAMGRKEEARRHFLEALERADTDERKSQIFYNLGTVSQSLNDHDGAMSYYRECIALDPRHHYALIRIGQLAELSGDRNLAASMYARAEQIEREDHTRSNLAKRHLAKIAAMQNRSDEARMLLHEALNDNRRDPVAMLMLASTFLDQGENPEIAASLARGSLSIEERPEGWQCLARALRALGREAEACQAEARTLFPQNH